MAAGSRGNWNGLAAVTAAFVGFLALVVSAYTAYIQRQQTRAQVWPRLLVGNRPADRLVAVYNKGMGPAIVRTVQIYVDGRPQPDWTHVVDAAGLHLGEEMKVSTLTSVVISPGEELHLLKFASDADYMQFMQAKKVPEMRVCYCSVLDECWAMDEREKNPVLQIQEMRSCPLDPAVDFKQ